MMLGLLTFTIFNFLITISLGVLIFEKKFSVFSKMVQATTSPFSVSPSSLRRKSCLKLLVFSVTPYEIKNRKPLNRLSPESGEREKVNIQTLAKIQVTAVFLKRDIRKIFLTQIYRDFSGDVRRACA